MHLGLPFTTGMQTDTIEQAVKAVCEQILTKPDIGQSLHRRVQGEIAKLAQQFGFTAIKEYVLPAFRGDRDGRLDVVWTHGKLPVIAFEIDSCFRRKSIHKLLTVNAEFRYWVYFGESDRNADVKQIDTEQKIRVVHLPKAGTKPSRAVHATSSADKANADKQSKALPSKPTGSYSVAKIRELS